jgi:hypothetical protein
MHPPTYVCTHISVHKTIIEDKKTCMQPINKVFYNCQEQSQLKLRHRYNRLWENNRLYHTSCLPRDYTRGIKMVLLYMMMMNTSEGVEPIGGDFGSIFPPSNSSGDSLLSLRFFVFDLCTTVLRGRPGDPFYSRF